MFGWFPGPLVYVVTHCVVRDDLELDRGPEWDKAIRRVETTRLQLLPGIAPFHSESFADYVGDGGDGD